LACVQTARKFGRVSSILNRDDDGKKMIPFFGRERWGKGEGKKPMLKLAWAFCYEMRKIY